MLPHTPSSHSHTHLILLSVSLLTAALLASLAAIFLFLRRRSSASRKPAPNANTNASSSRRSSEFLYLGTIASSSANSIGASVPSPPYHTLGSPELNPLPPLPKLNNNLNYNETGNDNENDIDDDEFFSPKGSGSSSRRKLFKAEPSDSINSITTSPSTVKTASPDLIINFITPSRPPPPPPPLPHTSNDSNINFSSIVAPEETNGKPKLKALHWDKVRASSDRAMVWDNLKSNSFQLNEEMIETLFIANSTSSNMASKDNGGRHFFTTSGHENRVLDPKKSQNIAILLRALNVTTDDVCEGLLEGNSDSLGVELLESLLKMAPSKEEEWKLREYKDDSPFKLGPAEKFLKSVIDIPFAFKRVDALLYIANFDSEVDYLKRSFTTLEVACGELKDSRMLMKLLEAVLKTGNRMNVGTNRGDARAFKLDTLLKLVDVKGADGKTTLLHFVVQEIIRAEGLRLSVMNQSVTVEKSKESSYWDDVEFRKLGLQVVSGLSGELTNVKKAATMDSDVLSNEVVKLVEGIAKVAQVLKSNEEVPFKESSRKLSESMNEFLKKAEHEIGKLQAQWEVTLSLVREITEYFHGNTAKEEAHRFRIFTVVRDFLSILDQVCKEVGKVNERSTVGLGTSRQFTSATNVVVFPDLDGGQPYVIPDDDSPSFSS